MDLFSGYRKVALAKNMFNYCFCSSSSAWLLGGLFQYNRVCFRLCNAPATLCRLLTKFVETSNKNLCDLYVNDFFMFSKSFAQHSIHLEKVLRRLKKLRLKVKPSKCAFGKSRITVLGHKVSKEELCHDPGKVTSNQYFPQLHNFRTLRGWLVEMAFSSKIKN